MSSLLVDEKELQDFLDWLPEIDWHQCYVCVLLIRARGLKEKFGFKGSEHAVQLKFVPGYYGGYTRFRLELTIKRLALLAWHSELFPYFRHKPGTDEIEEVVHVPRELMAVMVSPNPSRWVVASVDTVQEFMKGLITLISASDAARKEIRRLDVRLPANCMKRQVTIFHQIDVDTKDRALVEELEKKMVDILGYLPAKLETPHGYHYLPKVFSLDREMAKKWFGYFRHEFLPQFGNVVEYKTKFLEPCPGCLYQGDWIVRFKPEEG